MDEQEKNAADAAAAAEAAAKLAAKQAEGFQAIAAKCKAFVDGGTLDELGIWDLAAEYELPAKSVKEYLAETKKRVAEEAERFAEQLKKAAPEAPKEVEVFISADNAQSEQKPEPQLPLPMVIAQWVPDCLEKLNHKHAVIGDLGGKCVVMEWVPSRITEGVEELSFQSFTSFKERYQNLYQEVPGAVRRMPAAAVWLAHPLRRQYERIDLVPNGAATLPGNVLNLWRGWGVEPKKGDWRLLRQHMLEVIANGDPVFYDYIWECIAWKLQNPDKPTEVAIALTGGKGAGKGVLGRVLLKIFGAHGLQIHSTDLLTGKHNAHLQDKLFLFLDEAIWAADHKAERVLKGIITEPWMMIEPKLVNAYQWRNRMMVLMAGNDKRIVPASHDERRYAVNAVSEAHKQDKNYFVPLWAEIENGGAAAMLHEMLNADLGDFHPRDHVPQTGTLIEQKQMGLEGLEQWYVELLSSGFLPWDGEKKSNPRLVSSQGLLESAKQFSPRTKYVNPTELGNFLRDHGCTPHKGMRGNGWIFPPLVDARRDWEVKAGEWPWLFAAEDWNEKPKGT